MRRLAAAFTCVCLLLPVSAKADGLSSSATATAAAVIIEPLSVHRIQRLRFGYVRGGDDGGDVTVEARRNRRSFSGTASARPNNGFSRARFRVRGAPYQYYTVTLPGSVTAARGNRGNGDTSLPVHSLHAYSVTSQAEDLTGQINSNGRDTLRVGGTVTLPAHAAGNYSARFDVVVTYQ